MDNTARERLQWPGLAWLSVFFALPLLLVGLVSFARRGPYGGVELRIAFESWSRLADALYLTVLGRSLVLAAATTVICAALAFPISLWMARQPRRRQGLLVLLVLIPFWTNLLVRLYAWMFLLGTSGPLNALLRAVSGREQLDLLFTLPAVLLGLVYDHLPYMILPLYAALERGDWTLVDAARDLYASAAQVFLRVILPMSLPGLAAGGVLVFVWALGDFVTPDLLGGSKHMMVGNLIQQQYLVMRDWPFGSALSLLVIAVLAAGALAFRGRFGESEARA